MMKQLINLVFCCTDREALNLSIFFSETFALLERWRVRCRSCKAVNVLVIAHIHWDISA